MLTLFLPIVFPVSRMLNQEGILIPRLCKEVLLLQEEEGHRMGLVNGSGQISRWGDEETHA